MINDDQLKNALKETDSSYEYVEPLVDNLVNKCCDKLDRYMSYVVSIIGSEDYNVTDAQLDDIIMTIPTLLYFVGVQQERLGIKQDISESNRKILYNKIFTDTQGTVGHKNATAEAMTFNEDMVTVVYKRAYNIIKGKVQFSMELMQSAKKILTRRMTENELSKITPNKSNS